MALVENFLKSRDLLYLGINLAKYIVYPRGNGYYIDEVVEERLRSCGLQPNPDELDEIFWCFLNPEIRRVVEQFRRRDRSDQKRRIRKDEGEKVKVFRHAMLCRSA